MSEIRDMVAYDDIVIGEDFNSRKSFREFVKKAFNTDAEGHSTLEAEDMLKKVLSPQEMLILDKLKELASSIAKHGLLQPLIVREGGPTKTDGKRRYFLIAGERRYRAVGLIRETDSSKFRQVEIKLKKCNADDSALYNFEENLKRDDLTPMEVALNIEKFMSLGKLTQAQVAKKIDKSEPYVSQHLALLKAAPEVRAAVEKGDITATHVREMSALPPATQAEVLKTVEGKKTKGQKTSVADVKVEADKHKKALGIKQTRERKPKDGDPVYDVEKVKAAKEIIGDRDIAVRPKKALLEQYGTLSQRLGNPNISEATTVTTKAKIAALEYCMGVRDTL
jgi:ParB family chromosome partitioning protein